MHGLQRAMVGLMAAASLIGVGGCGDGKPSVDTSHTEATVKGTVKLKGVPATGGEIVFDPSNYKRKDVAARRAPIGKDGTYTITTLTGENQIRLGGDLAKKIPMLAYESRSLDVRSGENAFDFDATTGPETSKSKVKARSKTGK